jgi:hypothetical protein
MQFVCDACGEVFWETAAEEEPTCPICWRGKGHPKEMAKDEPTTLSLGAHMYTADEKARIRRGLQCPKCFGVDTRPRPGSSPAFECSTCGERWHGVDPQFQICKDRSDGKMDAG